MIKVTVKVTLGSDNGLTCAPVSPLPGAVLAVGDGAPSGRAAVAAGG